VPTDNEGQERAASDSRTDRYELKEKLGAGGMGVVYRAHDRERRCDVALKTLRRFDGAALYRFKREFRSLADLVHPNLVTLYELTSTGADWFFTMELIEGRSLLEHVRRVPGPPRPRGRRLTDPAITTATVPPREATATPPGTTGVVPDMASWSKLTAHRQRVIDGELDLDRLRDAFGQLVGAVQFLHRAGKLHRDIKPSNVMVSGQGRVVLCDFGLVTASTGDERTVDERVLGTPTYMSPEQGAAGDVTEASDWYSVGVMLYEAMCGRRPFSGSSHDVMRQKLLPLQTRPCDFDPSLPPELDQLAVDLLRLDPAQRPDGDDILRALGAAPAAEPGPRGRTEAPPATPDLLVGRDDVLAGLQQALDDSRAEMRTISVFLHGASGVGKSAVVRQFLDQVRHDGRAIVLEGRCYERESVPYKALDALIDALSSHLARRPHAEVERLVPPDISTLARLFPVLDRVPAVAEAAELRFDVADPHESRRRGFAALRALLRRMCEQRPAVLFIDDLQWGDLDSAGFLRELLYSEPSPALLFVATYRRDEAQSSPLVQALRQPAGSVDAGNQREVALDALPDDQARLLVRALADDDALPDDILDAIVRESGGSPLFLCELTLAGLEGDSEISLDTVLRERLDRLPPEAQALLRTVAVAGQPIAMGVAMRAAGVGDNATALEHLLSGRFVRLRQIGETRRVESYHDRIRETVTADLPERDLRRVHRRLARALEAQSHPDPLELVDHWLGAGDQERAGHYAALAATMANTALAFDRAAHNYRLALELVALAPGERSGLLVRLGEALANAGRLAEAAQAFQEAAGLVGEEDALDLKRRAVEQFVRAGRYHDGMALAREVLADVGMSMPRSNRRALVSVATSRAWIKLRGLGFRERPPSEVAPRDQRRMAVCFSLSGGLAVFEPILGTAFQMRHLRIALGSGDANHVALALAYEIGFRSVAGVGKRAECEALVRRAEALSARVDHPYALATTRFTSGLAAYLTGQWKTARDRLAVSEKMLEEIATGLTWERDVVVLFRLATLLQLGEIAELIRAVPAYLRDAADRGNQYLAIGLRSWRTNIAWLAVDDPDEAERQLELAVEALPLSSRDFHLPHYYRLLCRTQIALYRGEHEAAWQLVDPGYHALHHSLIRRIQFTRIESAFLRARVALARAGGASRGPMLDAAAKMAQTMTKERAEWGVSVATLVRAIVAAGRGDRAAAARLAAEAVTRFADDGMVLFAQIARWRQGELQADDEGAALRRDSRAWMIEQGIAEPERFVGMFAPMPRAD